MQIHLLTTLVLSALVAVATGDQTTDSSATIHVRLGASKPLSGGTMELSHARPDDDDDDLKPPRPGVDYDFNTAEPPTFAPVDDPIRPRHTPQLDPIADGVRPPMDDSTAKPRPDSDGPAHPDSDTSDVSTPVTSIPKTTKPPAKTTKPPTTKEPNDSETTKPTTTPKLKTPAPSPKPTPAKSIAVSLSPVPAAVFHIKLWPSCGFSIKVSIDFLFSVLLYRVHLQYLRSDRGQ